MKHLLETSDVRCRDPDKWFHQASVTARKIDEGADITEEMVTSI